MRATATAPPTSDKPDRMNVLRGFRRARTTHATARRRWRSRGSPRASGTGAAAMPWSTGPCRRSRPPHGTDRNEPEQRHGAAHRRNCTNEPRSAARNETNPRQRNRSGPQLKLHVRARAPPVTKRTHRAAQRRKNARTNSKSPGNSMTARAPPKACRGGSGRGTAGSPPASSAGGGGGTPQRVPGVRGARSIRCRNEPATRPATAPAGPWSLPRAQLASNSAGPLRSTSRA